MASYCPKVGVVVAQIETANPNTRGLDASVFSSEDLSFLQVVVEELLEGLLSSGDYFVQGDSREALKKALAKAVFACAHPGERDAASLKRRVTPSRIAAGRSSTDL